MVINECVPDLGHIFPAFRFNGRCSRDTEEKNNETTRQKHVNGLENYYSCSRSHLLAPMLARRSAARIPGIELGLGSCFYKDRTFYQNVNHVIFLTHLMSMLLLIIRSSNSSATSRILTSFSPHRIQLLRFHLLVHFVTHRKANLLSITMRSLGIPCCTASSIARVID